MPNDFDLYADPLSDPLAFASSLGVMDPAPSADPAIDLSHILGGLTDAQYTAATATGPVLAIAGAGTGKTRVLTTSIANRIATGTRPSRILAVTFTNKAAREMRERLSKMLSPDLVPSWVGTFHALSARMLRMEPSMAGLRDGFDVLDADDARRVLKRTMSEMNIDTKKKPEGADPVKMVSGVIDRLKDRLIDPDSAGPAIHAMIKAANDAREPVNVALLSQVVSIYPAYQRELTEGNHCDFGDLLLWPTLAMLRNENTRRRFADRWGALFIDEFQDVNEAQSAWIRLLAQDHRHLFVVGDDDQAIFSFRGADIRFIREFQDEYPEATTVRLEENFRSTGHILDAANAVIAGDEDRLGKTLYTRAPKGDPIQIIKADGADDEAHLIVREIARQYAQGAPWGHQAILYRNNHASRAFEDELIRRRIPYVIIGDVSFYQRQEVKDALAFLKLALHPDDRAGDEAYRRIANTPARGLGPKAMETIEQAAREMDACLMIASINDRAALGKAARTAARSFAYMMHTCAAKPGETLSDQFHRILVTTGYLDHWRNIRETGADARVENLQELVSLAGSFPTAEALFEQAALASARTTDQDAQDRVQLMTIHGSKGLEYPHVYLPAWEMGILPSARSLKNGTEPEERRLAYVAITRGMKRVTISHSTFRRGYMDPSPYIAELPATATRRGWLADASTSTPPTRRPAASYARFPDSRFDGTF